jgi:hypothetical protein
MTFLKSVLLLVCLSLIAALVGCSSSSSPTVNTPPPAITVSLSSPATFPATLYVNDTLPVTATVSNDSANGGVVWSCSPGNSASTCGSFSSGTNAVASGTAVTYTAPSNPVSAVTITATTVDSSSATASSTAIAINATVISVAFSTTAPPPSSLATGTSATIAATVTGDPAGMGVNWSCAPATACSASSFSPASTDSGATTTFTAPANAGSVTITATSISDDAQSVNASVAITGTTVAQPLAAGNYTFWLSGTDTNSSPYYVAGAFTVAPGGTATGGTISAGEQDFVDYFYVLQQDGITGSYTVTADGNLQITLNTNDPCIGPGANNTCGQSGSTSAGNGQEILNATLTSTPSSATSSARIMEFDSWATGGGQLEPQSAPATSPLGGYAFSVSGLDANNPAFALGIGGIINVDGTSGSNNTISGIGSVFDENDGGSLSPAQSFTASTVDATPDGFGRVTFTLNTTALGSPEIALVAYFVNGTHLRLVEGADNLGGTTGGQAFVQTGTGSFGTSSFLGSSYVFQTAGADNSTDGFLQAAGVLTGNSDGTTASGNVSFNDLTTNITPQGGTAITGGTYLVDQTGRVTLSNLNVGGVTYNLQLYLDGNGNARVLSMDGNDEIDGIANLQKGSLAASTFSGTYAMGAVGFDPNFLDEFDAVGPVVADGTANFPGLVDLNWVFNPTPPGPTLTDNPVTPATFVATSTAGIFTGNITGIDVTNCQVYNAGTTAGCTNDAFTYYFVNASTVVGIENDANQLTLIRFELQQ